MIEPPRALLLDVVISFIVSAASPWAYPRIIAWIAIPILVATFGVGPHNIFETTMVGAPGFVIFWFCIIAGIPTSAIGTALGYAARRAIITARKRFGPRRQN